jgi:hypothetical protein
MLSLCAVDCQNVIATNNNACGLLSEIRCTHLWPGRYWLVVDPGLNATCGTYRLDIHACCRRVNLGAMTILKGVADADGLANDMQLTFAVSGEDAGNYHLYRAHTLTDDMGQWQEITPAGGLATPAGGGTVGYWDKDILNTTSRN